MNQINIPISRKNVNPLMQRVNDMYDVSNLHISGVEECKDSVHVYINVHYRDPYFLFSLGQDLALVDLFGYDKILDERE